MFKLDPEFHTAIEFYLNTVHCFMMLVIIYFLTFNRTNIFAKEIENMTEQHKNSN